MNPMNLESLKIREFLPDDAKEILRLHRNFSEYFEEFEISEEFILNISQRDDFKFFIAAIDKKLVGFVGTLFYSGIGRAEIGPIAVDNQHKNNGVGKILMKHVLNFLKQQGIHRVVVRVKSINNSALNFFETLGFEEEGYFQNYTRRGEDVIQMVKFP